MTAAPKIQPLKPTLTLSPGAPPRGADAGAHTRVNETWLAGRERRTLRWLAERLPAWVTPDQMTALGFVACLLILAGYWLTNVHPAFLWLASAGFALNWFGDSLDGTLARYRKIERPRYGYFLDHSVDTVNMLLVGLGLGLSPFVRMDLALLSILGYYMMSILTYLCTHVRGVFQLSYARVGPTEVRIGIVLINTLVWVTGNPSLNLGIGSLGLFDLLAAAASTALIGTFVVCAWKQAQELGQLDRPGRS